MTKTVASAASARFVTLPLAAVFSLMTASLIIQAHGLAAYAQYGLLISLAGMLPFADLGVGAALTNRVGVALANETINEVRGVLLTSLRLLISSCLFIAGLGLVVTLGSWWPTLLGPGSGTDVGTAASLSWALFALGVPLALGQRLLVSVGRNVLQTLVIGMQAPMTFVGVTVALAVDAPAHVLAPIFYGSSCACLTAMLVLASRQFRTPLAWAVSRVHRLRSVRGESIRHSSLPMIVLMVALPAGLASDRIVLSHMVSPQELSAYNLAGQFYSPVLAVLSTAAASLWPIYARRRAAVGGEVAPSSRLVVGFAAAGLLGSAVVFVVGPVLVEVVSAGALTLDVSLALCFSAFVVAQGGQYALGSMLTGERALKVQACLAVVALPLNLFLSYFLVGYLGAGGPVLASAIAVLAIQTIPLLAYARSGRGTGRTVNDSAADAVGTHGAGTVASERMRH